MKTRRGRSRASTGSERRSSAAGRCVRRFGARPGERVLDVGCGPGFYCAELAEEVGPSGSVVGVDGSQAMLALAGRRCARARQRRAAGRGRDRARRRRRGLRRCALRAGARVRRRHAGRARGAPPCAQARRAGARLGHRLGDVLDAGRRAHPACAAAWDEHLTHSSLPRTLAPSLRAVGFEDVRAQAHPLATIAFDPETYGGAMVPFIAGVRRAAGRASVRMRARPGSRRSGRSTSAASSTSRSPSSASQR